MKRWNVLASVARLGAPKCRSRAFTLIELLVVIAIIALVIAFFVPSTRDFMSRGYIVKCADNLRHIGEAAHGRKADGREDVDLREGFWVAEIVEYLGGVESLACPEGSSSWAASESVEAQIVIRRSPTGAWVPLVVGEDLLKLSDTQWQTMIAEGRSITPPVPYVPDGSGVYWWGWDDGPGGAGDNDFQDMAVKVTPAGSGLVDVFVQSSTSGSPEIWTTDHSERLTEDTETNKHKHGAGTYKEFLLVVTGGDCSYGMNTAMLKLDHQTKMLALDYGSISAASTDIWTDAKWDVDGDGDLDFARHMGRINVLFVNGSVKLRTIDEIDPFDPTAESTYWLP